MFGRLAHPVFAALGEVKLEAQRKALAALVLRRT
jgi:hypothetical protein